MTAIIIQLLIGGVLLGGLYALIAFGLAIQFTPPDTLQRTDRLYHRLPGWAVGVLIGVTLLVIEAIGGDGAAPFIYFQF